MTIERWTDEMLNALSTDIRMLTNLATQQQASIAQQQVSIAQQQASIGSLINLAAQQQADIRALVSLAAQQQENMVLMQTEISTAQEEIRQIWRRLDIDTGN